MVQSLSAESSFGIQISLTPVRIALPNKWNVVGTAADFFISVSATIPYLVVFSSQANSA